MGFTDAVDDVADAPPPIGSDGEGVFFAGRGSCAGAVDDIADILRARGSCAAGSAVADVLGAGLRPGVFEGEHAGVFVKLHVFSELGDVNGVPGDFAGDLVVKPRPGRGRLTGLASLGGVRGPGVSGWLRQRGRGRLAGRASGANAAAR